MDFTYRSLHPPTNVYRTMFAYLNADGTANLTPTINGQVCVAVNRDGSIARGVLGTVPGDPYSPGVIPSVWESQT